MLEWVIENLSLFIISAIEATAYWGIVALMAAESANIPIPSEIIMPFSGFLVSAGKFNFWLVVLAGSVGNLIGSWVSYEIGLRGGRQFMQRYGKFFFVRHDDIELAEYWFTKYGSFVIFFSRLLPVVRTFISFPAGIARMDKKKFLFLTFAGSVPWNIALTYIGFVTGENWDKLEGYFRTFDWFIVAIIISGAAIWAWRHIKNS